MFTKPLYLRILYCVIIAILTISNYVLLQKLDTIVEEKDQVTQNLKAARDTIRITETKNKELEYSKSVYVAKAKDLEKLNGELSNELAKEKGTVKYIAVPKLQFIHDTLYLENTVTQIGSSYRYSFKHDTTYSPGNYRTLSGYTQVDTSNKSFTMITDNQMGVKLVTGLKETKENGWEIFIRSDYPGFKVTSLDGAIVDPKLFQKPKPKKIGIGPSAGYQFDFASGKFRPYFGFGIQYNLIRL